MKYVITVDIKDEEGVVEFDVHTGDGTPLALKGVGFKREGEVFQVIGLIISEYEQRTKVTT